MKIERRHAVGTAKALAVLVPALLAALQSYSKANEAKAKASAGYETLVGAVEKLEKQVDELRIASAETRGELQTLAKAQLQGTTRPVSGEAGGAGLGEARPVPALRPIPREEVKKLLYRAPAPIKPSTLQLPANLDAIQMKK